MKIGKLFYVLYKIELLSPKALYQLFRSFLKCGINLMALLDFAGKKYAQQTAIVDDQETLSYEELFEQSNKLAIALRENVQLQNGQRVGFLCHNHASLIKSIFAVSRLGADVYLLNTEMSQNQLDEMVNRHNFAVLIYDAELSSCVEQSAYTMDKVLSYHDYLPAVNNFLQSDTQGKQSLPITSGSKIILQTGGTTGASKDVAHKPSLFNYLTPFLAFVERLKVLDYQTAYIATPVYHGYGIAVLLLFVPLGKKVVISRRFVAQDACRLIREHQVEVVTVVPLMLQRMLHTNADDLKSLACIASGGARLNPKLVEETFQELGDVLYNLYGTSEAGLNFIATPEDLKYAATTVGKGINGMQVKVLDENKQEVENGKTGRFYVKNDWSMSSRNNSWIDTGDLGYRDENGYYFLSGRKDDMIVSGGENVYPAEVEQALLKHSAIEDAAVTGIDDSQFGQRLKAFVLPMEEINLTEEEILAWLRPRVARFQLPKEIQIVESMPYTPVGKLDKKQLH